MPQVTLERHLDTFQEFIIERSFFMKTVHQTIWRVGERCAMFWAEDEARRRAEGEGEG